MAKAPRSQVVGTAGHIDHGKTTLVAALTGVDTDRLAEEKRRGITIDLGFAPWSLAPGLEVSVVDVPGHEGLVRTMVAGAGGIDLVLLVISAEDGVMPQTREHLHVCSLLGIAGGVVALTKIDRLGGDPETVALAREEIREALADTPFAEAPILPCSAPTGEGIAELRGALRRALAALPRRPREDRPILPIDRIFSMKGHGTVVTGSLLQGEFRLTEGPCSVIPVGAAREAQSLRIRGLEVRGAAVELARAGDRLAVNLAGVATEALHRGDVLSRGDRVLQAAVFHVLATHLPHDSALWAGGSAVEICAGTAHGVGRLDPLARAADGTLVAARELAPGERGLVRIRVEPAIPIWYGQRVILRRQHRSGDPRGDTIGGGVVVDPAPSSGRRQRARWIAVAAGLLGEPPARVLALLADAGALGCDRRGIEGRAGVVEIDAALAEGVASGAVLPLGGDRWVLAGAVDGLVAAAVAAVDAFHDAHPLAPGIGRAAALAGLAAPGATGGLRVAGDVAEAAIDRACAAGELLHFPEQGVLTRPGRGLAEATLPPALAAIVALYEAAGSTPPTLKEVGAATGMAPRPLLDAISNLQRLGALIRVSDELSLAARAHRELVEAVRGHLQAHGELDVQALKQLTGLSRKFAVPLLEHFDRIQLTRRVGDRRVAGGRVDREF